MEMIEFLQNKKSELAVNLAFAILSGALGTLLLLAFLLLFVNAFRVIPVIPFIVAFNTAMTGYSVIDKCRKRIQRKYCWALGAGLANVVIAYALMASLSLQFIGENLLGARMFFLLLAVGAGCSVLGALLAVKYFKMR